MQAVVAQSEGAEVGSEGVTQLVGGAGARLAHLSNDEVLSRTRSLVGKTNLLLAALLEHLGEVEARGLHRLKLCASLYTYCIYELRFSEDAASRRASAARIVRQFPAALEAISRGELHLTGLLQVAPILTDANHLEVLARARYRTKKEIAKLVRRIAPLPEVPDRIEPLGTHLQNRLRSPTWAEFVESMCPPVRELTPGDRPSDWANDTAEVNGNTAPARESNEIAESTAPARVDRPELPPLEEPQLYHLQFTATEEHVELIEKAKALLSHRSMKWGLAELHLQALRLLVEAIEKKRFGSKRGAEARPEDELAPDSASSAHDRRPQAPRPRSRAIPARLRRQVYERDGGRCTFVDREGDRCRETRFIQLHHVVPFARGGQHQLDNLTLRCAAHNALAADADFGRGSMERSVTTSVTFHDAAPTQADRGAMLARATAPGVR